MDGVESRLTGPPVDIIPIAERSVPVAIKNHVVVYAQPRTGICVQLGRPCYLKCVVLDLAGRKAFGLCPTRCHIAEQGI